MRKIIRIRSFKKPEIHFHLHLLDLSNLRPCSSSTCALLAKAHTHTIDVTLYAIIENVPSE